MNFVKYCLYSYWDNHRVFIHYLITMIHHSNQFSDIKPSLWTWSKFHIEYGPFITVLNSIYWYFDEEFCIYVLWRDLPWNQFKCSFIFNLNFPPLSSLFSRSSLHLIFLPLSPYLLYFLLSHSHFIYVYHVPSTIGSFETNGKMLTMIPSSGNTQSILGSQSFKQVLSMLKGCYGYMWQDMFSQKVMPLCLHSHFFLGSINLTNKYFLYTNYKLWIF